MYVAIYQWHLHEGRAAEFARNWREASLLFREEHGALGSRLHRAEDGTYFAYAQWPSREAYQAPKVFSARHREVLEAMQTCVRESQPATLGEMLDDCLVPLST